MLYDFADFISNRFQDMSNSFQSKNGQFPELKNRAICDYLMVFRLANS